MLSDDAVTSAHRFGLRTPAARGRQLGRGDPQHPALLGQSGRLSAYQKELLRLAGRQPLPSSAKADALRKLLEAQAQGDTAAAQGKVLLFTQFRATLEMLAARLTEWGVDFALYHGG